MIFFLKIEKNKQKTRHASFDMYYREVKSLRLKGKLQNITLTFLFGAVLTDDFWYGAVLTESGAVSDWGRFDWQPANGILKAAPNILSRF